MGRRLSTPAIHDTTDMEVVGGQLRARRKSLGLTMDDVAKKAGLSRVTLYRVEKGEPSVNAGALVRVARVLGTHIAVGGDGGLPPSIRLSDYPGLSRLGWQLAPDTELSPYETWSLLSRTWRHIDDTAITAADARLITQLEQRFGVISDVSAHTSPSNLDGTSMPQR